MRFIITFFLCLVLSTQQISGADIIPTPKKIHLGSDSLDISQVKFQMQEYSDSPSSAIVANTVALVKDLPIQWANRSHDALIFSLYFRGKDARLDKQMESRIDQELLKKNEGYFIEIDSGGIFIYGFDQAGMLYAVQSMRQLLVGQSKLPMMEILDYPSFSYRGIMDDISRGPLPHLAFMKEQVRRLSLLKINVLSFYIEDVIRTKTHPEYAPEFALTLADIDELATYADSFNVKLMGSFQSLGHFKKILKHPQFSSLGASERMLKPGDPAAQAFLLDNYADLLTVFNHHMFNINADEAYDLERGPDLKRLADSLGVGQIYINHVKPLLKYINDRGMTPSMWGDMLLKHPEVISQLPEETVVFTWNYSASDDFTEFIEPFARRGIKLIAAPGIVNSYRLWPDLMEAEKNISVFAHQAWKYKALGVLTTTWDDGGRHFFTTDWWGVVVGSQHSWNPEKLDHKGLSDTYFKNFYAGEIKLYGRFLEQLHDLQQINSLSRLDASLVELRFNPDQDKISYIDTSDFSSMLDQLQEIKKTTIQLRDQKQTGTPLFSRKDFDYWMFKFDELQHSILSQRALLRLTDLLTTKESSIVSDSIRLLCHVQESVWKKLLLQFERLWLGENNRNWFADAKKPLLDKIQFWSDMSQRATRHDAFPRFRASGDRFFTYWLSADFIALTEQREYDFLKPEGGELKIKPSAVGYYVKPHGEYHSWRKIISQDPNTVWLEEFFDIDSVNTVYTSCQIVASGDMSVPFEFISSGESKIILNGKVISTHESPTANNMLKLVPGRNYLLLKHTRPASGPWHFSFRLPGEIVQNRKYRYYLE